MIFGKYINKYYKKYWYFFLLIIIIDAFIDVVQLTIPQITGGVISILSMVNDGRATFTQDDYMNSSVTGYYDEYNNYVNVPFFVRNFKTTLISLAVITLIIVVGRIIWRILAGIVSGKIDRELRKDMFDHIQTLSLNYYANKKVGALLSFFTSDLQSIKILFQEGFILLTDLLVLGGLSFIYMVQYSWSLALICSIPLILFFVVGGLVLNGETKRSKIASDSFEELSDYTEESLQGYKVINAFRKEQQRYNSFSEYAKDTEVKNIKLARYTSAIDGGINAIIYFSYILLFVFGYRSFIVGDNTLLNNLNDPGDFVTFASYVDTLIWPMIAGAILINDISNAGAAYQRISQIFDTKEDVIDNPNSLNHDRVKGEIEFNHLSFTYPESEKEVLHDISFKVKPKKKIGIIGKTGSGKSTLVSLLCKLYQVNDNSIKIDGDDINLWKKADLRNHIHYVFQNSFVFSGKLKESIAFEKEGIIDSKKLDSAASFADLTKDIEKFTDKYNTVVGEKGSTLSGGQRQRVSLARAIYSSPSVLILDDFLSAVDAETQQNIINNVKSLKQDLTTFIIAHQVSAIDTCDLILVMDDGRIIDSGKHDKLKKSCELYKNFIKMQELENEVNNGIYR